MYLKTIRKKNRKEDLLKPNALAKVAETMIELPGNKEVSKIMKTYYEGFIKKFPEKKWSVPKVEASKKMFSPIKKNIRNTT